MRKTVDSEGPTSVVTNARRRSLLRSGVGLGLGAAGLTAGCTTTGRQQITTRCVPLPAPLLVGTEVTTAWRGSRRYFDAHTHFFNGRDVPVEGFLARSVAHSLPSATWRQVLIELAPIAQALASWAPMPREEYDQLCRGQLQSKSLATESAADLDDEIANRRNDVARELFREIIRRNTNIPAIVNQAEAEAQEAARTRGAGEGARAGERPALPPFQSPADDMRFGEQYLSDALSGRRSATLSTPGARRRAPAAPSGPGIAPGPSTTEAAGPELNAQLIAGVFEFVGLMLSPRHHNLRTFIAGFAAGSPNTPLSGCFAAMVDFGYWLGNPACVANLEDQVRLHEMLALMSRGFLMPLVPYNPWVDIQDPGASLALVKKAITEHGCVGVKIYPPMGYAPYDNSRLAPNGDSQRPDPKQLDARLLALYEYCASEGIPVLAHSNESNGLDTAHDALGRATGWKRLSDRVPLPKRLTVIAGHFGGAVDHDSGNWSAEFAGLMQASRSLTMYGDLAYWNELHGDSEVPRQRLAELLSRPLASGGTVADRVLYGSDWHMLSREPNWGAYPDQTRAVIDCIDGSGTLATRILGGNALQCFGLNAGGNDAQLARLLSYYKQFGNDMRPGWA